MDYQSILEVRAALPVLLSSEFTLSRARLFFRGHFVALSGSGSDVFLGINFIVCLNGWLRCRHVALTVEEPSRVYQQAGSIDVAHHAAVLVDFQTFLGVNGSPHFARDAHHSALRCRPFTTFTGSPPYQQR